MRGTKLSSSASATRLDTLLAAPKASKYGVRVGVYVLQKTFSIHSVYRKTYDAFMNIVKTAP